MFPNEKIFADKLKEQNKRFVYQPKRFKLQHTSYRTDFYCLSDDIYYEVIGTRQAFSQKRKKLIEFIEAYPYINFKIVKPNGKEYISRNDLIESKHAFGEGYNWWMFKMKKTKKTKLFSFYIFLDLLKKAQRLAKKERRSIASVINQALDEFFEKE